jgi:hypothetical protein
VFNTAPTLHAARSERFLIAEHGRKRRQVDGLSRRTNILIVEQELTHDLDHIR